MTAIAEHIKREHGEFAQLLDQLIDAEGEMGRSMIRPALKRLDAHAKAEEQIIFTALMDDQSTRGLASELVEWHHLIRHQMRKVVSLDLEDEGWKANMRVARGVFRLHFEVEEEEALPLLRRVLGPNELDRIDREFRQIEEELLARTNMPLS